MWPRWLLLLLTAELLPRGCTLREVEMVAHVFLDSTASSPRAPALASDPPIVYVPSFGDGRVLAYDGLPDAPVERTFALLTDPAAVAVADFSADGALDVAMASASFGAVVRRDSGASLAGPEGFNGSTSATLVAALGGSAAVFVFFDAEVDADAYTLAGFDAVEGSFTGASARVSGAGAPAAIAVDDLDGDGATDVLVASAAGLVVVGDLLQQPPQTISTGAGNATWVTVADVDDDGFADAVVTHAEADAVVLFGDGAGGFSRNRTVEGSGGAAGAAVADFDLDGDVDVLVPATASGNVTLFYDGFHNATVVAQLGAWAPASVSVSVSGPGDVDGDGDGGDVVLAAGDTLLWLEAQSVPFVPANFVAEPGNQEVRLQWDAAADNGAAVLGYAVRTQWRNRTSWNFTEALTVTFEGLDNGEQYEFAVLAFNTRGDSNLAPVATATPTTPVELAVTLLTSPVSGPRDIAVADFNGDGIVDMVHCDSQNAGNQYWWDFLDGTSHYIGHSGKCYDVYTDGDVNGDGVPDIAVTHLGSSVLQLSLGDSDSYETHWFGKANSVAFVDADLDGVDDVVYDYDGVLKYFPGPDFSNVSIDFNGIELPDSTDSYYSLRGAFDVDGDGRRDLVSRFAGVLHLDGMVLDPEFSTGIYRVLDFDADGDLDILLYQSYVYSILRQKDDGSGFATEVVLFTAANAAGGFVAVDLDLDGDVDVVAEESDYIVVHYNDGGELDAEGVTLYHLTDTREIEAGDFDGDGDTDLAIAAYSAQSLAWLQVLTVPLPVASVSVEILDAFDITVNVSWPAADGNGANVANYTVGGTTTVPGNTTWVVLSGLAAGTAHTLDVVASNYRGASPATPAEYDSCSDGILSGDDDGVDCGGLRCMPCPLELVCTPGDHEVNISWPTQRAAYYELWVNGESTPHTTTGLSITVGDLDNYAESAFTLTAFNSTAPAAECTATPRIPMTLGATSTTPGEWVPIARDDVFVLLYPSTGAATTSAGASGSLGAAQCGGVLAPGLIVTDALDVFNATTLEPASAALTGLAGGACPAFADLDDDGDDDAVLSSGSVAQVFLFDGAAFALSRELAIPSAAVPTSALCDLDRDGDVDLFVPGLAFDGVETETTAWGDVPTGALACSVALGGLFVDGDTLVPVTHAHADQPPLVVVDVGIHEVNVSWEAASAHGVEVDSYSVLINDTVQVSGSSALNFTIGTELLLPGTAYAFSVVATNAGGDSRPRTVVASTFDVPDVVEDLECAGLDYETNITWRSPNDRGVSVTSFVVLAEESEEVVLTSPGYYVAGLPNWVQRNYSVRAVNQLGASAAAECSVTQASVKEAVLLPSPFNVTVGFLAAGDINGDGERDLVAPLGGEIRWLDGFVLQPEALLVSTEPAPSVGDWDGDGNVDLLADGTVWAGPAFATALTAGIVSGSQLVDTDGDGFAEVVESDASYCQDGSTLRIDNTTGSVSPYMPGLPTGASSVLCYEAGESLFLDGQWYTFPMAHPDRPTGVSVVDVTADGGAVLACDEWADGPVDAYDAWLANGTLLGTSAAAESIPASVYSRSQLVVSARNAAGASITSEPGQLQFAAVDVDVAPVAGGIAIVCNASDPVRAMLSTVVVQRGDRVWTLDDCPELIDGAPCSSDETNVTLVFHDAEGVFTTEHLFAAAVPWGVCPHSCSDDAAATWIDPSREDPFVVVCDGNWTLLPSDDDRKQLLASEATEARFADGSVVELWTALPDNATAVQTRRLNTTFTATPDTHTPLLVDVHRDFGIAHLPLGAGVELSVDYGEWTAWALSGNASSVETEHSVRARAVLDWFPPDPNPAEAVWVYDKTAPIVSFPSRPAALSPLTDAVFALAADETPAFFAYAVDSEPAGAQASVEEPEVLPETVLDAVEGLRFNVSSPDSIDASFEYNLDAAGWSPGAASLSLEGQLDDGWHSLLIRAAVPGGADESPLAMALAVGVTVEPDTLLSSEPDPESRSPTVAVECSLSDCSFEGRLDNATEWTPFNGSVGDVALGVHLLAVRSVSVESGKVDPTPLLVVWTVVEPSPPDTVLVSGPAAVVESGSAMVMTVACSGDCEGFEVATAADGWQWRWSDSGGTLDLGELPDDSYAVAWRAVDAEGRRDESPLVVAWQVAPAPVATLALAPPAVSSVSMGVFAVEVSGGSNCSSVGEIVVGPLDYGVHTLDVAVECELPAAPLSYSWEVVAETSSLSVTFAALADGAHVAWLEASDRAGNLGERVEYEWTVDTEPPDTFVQWWSVDGRLRAFCNDTHPGTVEVLLDGEVAATVDSGDTAVVSFADYADGPHNYTVVAVDGAGNADPTPEVIAFTLDRLPPVVNVSVASPTQAPEFSIVCEDVSPCETYWVVVGFAAGVLPAVDGEYTVVAVAEDAVGNNATASAVFVLDTTAPETLVDVDRLSASRNVTVNVTCVDSSFESSLPVSPSSSQLSFDVDGEHEWEVRCVDEAGNEDPSPFRAVILVDTVPPTVSLAVPRQLGDGLLAVEATCSEAPNCSVALSLSGNGTVVSPSLVQGDVEGVLTVRASAVDVVGNEALHDAVANATIDLTPPLIAIALSVAPYTTQAVADVDVAVTDLTAVNCSCSIDGVGTVACGGAVTVAVDGPSVFEVECVDEGLNVGAANASWVLDRAAPELSVGWPGARVNYGEWTIVTEVVDLTPIASVACWLDGFVVADGCAAELWTVTVEEEREYALFIEVTDSAGNAANASAAVTLDTTPPAAIQLDQVPDSATTDTTALFEFRCVTDADAGGSCGEVATDPDCTLAYSLDGADAVEYPAETPLALLDLATGSHQLTVSAQDEAGNAADDAVYLWTVRTDVPAPELLEKPDYDSGIFEAVFAFNVSLPNADFEYRVDGGDWGAEGLVEVWDDSISWGNVTVYLPPYAYDEHTFDVRVTGGGELVSHSWLVRRCDYEELEFVLRSAADCDEFGVPQAECEVGRLHCEACPEGAECKDGEGFVAPGSWWSHVGEPVRASSTFYDCRVEAACPGTGLNSSEVCAPGYEGVMCDSCSSGYGKNLDLTCAPCGDTDSAAFVGVVGSLFVVGVVVVATYMVQKSLNTNEAVRAVSTLKIMANYFLMMGILKDLDLDWGSMLRTLYSYMGVVSGSGAADVQLVNCVARVDTFTQFRLYFLLPVVLVLAPAAALWGYAGVRRAQWLLDNRPGGTLGSARIWGHSKAFVYRQALLVLSYFAYPVVVTNAFKVLHCTDIEGESRLVLDYSKLCSGPEYETLFAVGVFFATVVALGVPFGIFFSMCRRQAELSKAGKAQTQFYFFFGEFKPDWYWWEMTVMARKVVMGAIAVLLNSHPQKMQVYTGTWLLLFSFTAQITCLPHKDALQRRMETVAQGTVLASLLLGQGMAFADVTRAQRSLFQGCVLTINLCALTGMGAALAREMWAEARQRVKSLRRLRGRAATIEMQTRMRSVELQTRMRSGSGMGDATFENPMFRGPSSSSA